MEAFEAFVAIALENEGLVVSEAIKFPVKRPTRKAKYEEIQTHGYEVDLVGARRDKLVLATVKSFFGSSGVKAGDVTGESGNAKGYMLLNDPVIREGVIDEAAKQYGYRPEQIWLRLYVGKFAAPVKRTHEPRIREWCASIKAGAGPIEVVGIEEVVAEVRKAASRKQYRDNPVLVSMKVLQAAGLLDVELPEEIG